MDKGTNKKDISLVLKKDGLSHGLHIIAFICGFISLTILGTSVLICLGSGAYSIWFIFAMLVSWPVFLLVMASIVLFKNMIEENILLFYFILIVQMFLSFKSFDPSNLYNHEIDSGFEIKDLAVYFAYSFVCCSVYCGIIKLRFKKLKH